MLDMVKRGILPASLEYQNRVAELAERKARLSLPNAVETRELIHLGSLTESLVDRLDRLASDVLSADGDIPAQELAVFYRDHVAAGMEALREVVDELETRIPEELWPYPGYGEILYSVR